MGTDNVEPVFSRYMGVVRLRCCEDIDLEEVGVKTMDIGDGIGGGDVPPVSFVSFARLSSESMGRREGSSLLLVLWLLLLLLFVRRNFLLVRRLTFFDTVPLGSRK